ncbi:MAG: hypothetical protein IT362_06695 [Deltaproteobacteria bacterium]|nr:hypothetical protein [Deltaproteobacteria bacterium]
MDPREIKDVAEALIRRIEFLQDAGITGLSRASALKPAVPAIEGEPAEWVVFKGALKDAANFSACAHQDWKGVLFGVWPLGKAVVLWGVPVGAQTIQSGPFGAEPLSQLESMLVWLAGELKSPVPLAANPETILVARCPQDGGYTDTGAAVACLGSLEPYLKGAQGVLLMGSLAAWAFLQSADLDGARGRAHKASGRSLFVTYPPDDWITDQASKKAAHNDLKLLIREIAS